MKALRPTRTEGTMDEWREGARSGDPKDECPKGHSGMVFASDFKKFGKQSVRVCLECRAVYVNGKEEGPLDVFEG